MLYNDNMENILDRTIYLTVSMNMTIVIDFELISGERVYKFLKENQTRLMFYFLFKYLVMLNLNNVIYI
jgi:hypothetical protein